MLSVLGSLHRQGIGVARLNVDEHSLTNAHQLYRRLGARAGIELDPLNTWLLFRLQEQAPIAGAALAKRFHMPDAMLMPSIEALREIGLVTTTAPVEGQADGQLQLTAAGQETVATLVSACHESLAELLDGWSPEQEAELATLLHKVTGTLLSEKNTRELLSTPA